MAKTNIKLILLSNEIGRNVENLREFIPTLNKGIERISALAKQLALGSVHGLSLKQRHALGEAVDELINSAMIDFEEVERSAEIICNHYDEVAVQQEVANG